MEKHENDLTTGEISLEPGSLEAITQGCTCPPIPDIGVVDGARPLDPDCPLHGMRANQITR